MPGVQSQHERILSRRLTLLRIFKNAIDRGNLESTIETLSDRGNSIYGSLSFFVEIDDGREIISAYGSYGRTENRLYERFKKLDQKYLEKYKKMKETHSPKIRSRLNFMIDKEIKRYK